MKKLMLVLGLALMAQCAVQASVTNVSNLSGPAYTQVSDASVTTIDVHTLTNCVSAEIVTHNGAGSIVDAVAATPARPTVIIAPEGKWQWWTGTRATPASPVVYSRLFVFQSVPPDFYRINVVLQPRTAIETWGRWTKL